MWTPIPEDAAALHQIQWLCRLGRVPKALVLDALCEGAGAGGVGRTASSKEEVMVADAAALLDGKGWLRVPGATHSVSSGDAQATQPVPMAAE